MRNGNYARYKGYDLSHTQALGGYRDSGQVPDWASEAMEWAVGSTLVNGMDGQLAPLSSATRAQAAKVLTGFLEAYDN